MRNGIGRNGIGALRAWVVLAVTGLGLVASAFPSPVQAEGLRLDPKEYIPVREVRPGMTGYGLTVFKGTKVERFQFEVLGVLPKFSLGKPLILIRMSGGPITLRQANLIAGMSGSPCYINGRLLGAFSQGYLWPKEPIGMVTPIEEMTEAFDPKLPDKPAGLSLPPESDPTFFASPLSPTPPGLGTPMNAASLAGDWMRPYPMAIPVTVSGVTGRNFERLSRWLQPFNLLAQPGPGTKPEVGSVPLVAGSAVGVAFATGDIEMTGIGTVTYRKGNRLLLFGHPMMDTPIGALQLPITTAVVYDVFTGFPMSRKIASAVKMVGSTIQDRPFGIAAEIGTVAPMIPVVCDVDDRTTGRRKTFQTMVASHPLIVNQLAAIACSQAVMNVHPALGDTTARVSMDVKTEEFGTLHRENVVFGMAGVDQAAVDDLDELMRILSGNSFHRVPARAVTMKVVLDGKRNTATVERIFLPQERYRPGETVEVGVVLRPYRGEPYVTHTRVKIPQNAASGRAALTVTGGPPRPEAGPLLISAGGQLQAQGASSGGPTATTVAQLLRRYLQREKNNQLVARVLLPTSTVNVAGEKLSLLPANLADIMRSSRTSGLRVEREEVKSALDTDCVLAGSQTLQITIEREDFSENKTSSSSGAAASPASPGADSTSSYNSSTRTLNADEEADEVMAALPALSDRPVTFSDEDEAGPPAAPRGRSPRSSKNGKEAKVTSVDATPPTTPGTENKAVGRTAATWRQTSQADFERGKCKGSAVTATGEVRLAPALRALYESPEQYLWSVVAAPDAFYAGSGNGGLVYRITAGGEAKTFFQTGELEVHALARDKDGNLYAGTSPNGKVFRITPDGKGTEIFSLNEAATSPLSVPATGPQFVLALAAGADGALYTGTGPIGHVYKIEGPGKAKSLLSLPEKPIQSLLVAPDGTVWAGTAEDGLVYAIGPDGRSRVVYDSDQSAITSLARAEDGTIYAAASPKGIVYEISPTGEARVLFDKAKSGVQALALDAAGDVYAAAGNTIYRIHDRKDVTLLTDSERAQFVALARDPAGTLVATSANVGTLYRLERAASGVYESPVHDGRLVSRWGAIRWTADVPEGAQIKIETRSGNTRGPDASWSDWSEPVGAASGRVVASPPARYLQYRVTLGAPTGDGAILRDVTVQYLAPNQRPTLTLSTPVGGEVWRGSQTIRWTGSDPDKDTLTYEVFLSGDDGKTWKRLGERTRAESGTATPAKQPDSASAPSVDAEALRQRIAANLAADPALARFRKAVEDDPDLTGDLRTQALQRADQLIAGLGTDTEAKGLPAVTGTSATGGSGSSPGSTRDSSLSWNTAHVPDGAYRIKVIASDRVSNPTSPQTAEALSETIRVANHAPWLYALKKSLRVSPERTATLDGLAESSVPLQAAQYRIDSGDWVAIDAADGIWDTGFEAWSFNTSPLRPGAHTLEVKVIDTAGNAAAKMLSIEVPAATK